MLVTVEVGIQLLSPQLGQLLPYPGNTVADILACLIIYPVMALFVRPMLNFHSDYFTALWLKTRANHFPLIAMTVLKFPVFASRIHSELFLTGENPDFNPQTYTVSWRKKKRTSLVAQW